MGRVSLLVEANTSDAISKISGLGEAIKKAMSGFDSSKLATWEQSFDKQLQSVKGKLNDLKEKLKGLTNDFKADVPFGANNSIGTFKDRLKSADEALKTFKATFKDGYTFGAVAQIDSLKSKLNEAQKAIAALNAEAGKSTNLGANQNAKAKKDEITKTIAAVEQLNRSLAKKPVIGAVEAVRSLEQALQKLSANVPNYLSPISFSLNALKTQMLELSQVLNSVQQPTWVEPFKTKMQEVVKVLRDIATAYKNVKTEIKQPVGESPVRKEFQLTDRQAQNLGKTTTTFYRMLRKEFQETRRTATETARAIREAMAAVNGGGTGAGGTGTATAGTRLGFGEQLWSRMRSNLYSYLTMWFGVAGAIRAANGLMETHNRLLEQGRRFNQTEAEALGELNLKAGAKRNEYKKVAIDLSERGFGEIKSAYQFASDAAMSGISPEEMKDLAPLFKYNIAAGGDQKSLMAAISYIKKAYGDKYSAKQISGMILAANANQPSNIGPTANALQRLIKSFGGGLDVPLPDLIAMFTTGSEEDKDARIGTMLNAVATAIEARGLKAMVIGDYMRDKGVAGYDYYKDKATGEYKFKNAALQEQLENKELTLNNEMLSHVLKARGRSFLKDAGMNMRIVQGMKIIAKTAENPDEYNRILREVQAIADGDFSILENTIGATSLNKGASVETTGKAIENTTAIKESSRAALVDSVNQLRGLYTREHRISGTLNQWGSKLFDWTYGADWLLSDALENYAYIVSGSGYSETDRKNAKDAMVNAIRTAVKEYGVRYGYDINTEEGIKKTFSKVKQDLYSNVSVFDLLDDTHDVDNEFNIALQKEIAEFQDSHGYGKYFTGTAKPTAPSEIDKYEGGRYGNSWDEEELQRKENEKATAAAERERKAAELEAKRKEQEEARYAQAFLDALPKWSIRTKENEFIKTAYSNVSSDMSADLQALKPYALGSEIGAKSDSNKVLSKAFYAYASDMTDAATDKEIVKQMVGAMLAAGMNKEGIGNLVNAYWGEMRLNNAANIRSEDNRNAINNFQQAVLELLSSLNDEAKKGNEPPVNPAASRPAPATARR